MIRRMGTLIVALFMCLTLLPAAPASAATYDNKFAAGEPSCSGWVFKNCNMRSLYRNVYWNTTTGDRANVQAAVLMVAAPYVGKDRQLRSTVEQITFGMNRTSFSSNKARCVRGYTLQAIQNQAKDSTLSHNIANTFSVAKSSIRVTGKLMNGKRSDTWFAPVLNAYMKVGKEAAAVAGKITASKNTRGSMYSALMC